jgi:hypothetical protein
MNPFIPADTWVEVDFCYRSGTGTWNQTLRSVAVRFTYDNSVDQTIWIDDLREAPLNRLSPNGFHLQANDDALQHKSLLALPDGNVLGLFRKQGSAYLYTRIFRPAMDGMLSETLINPYAVEYQPGMALLADGSVAITYRDTARAETLLVLLDSSGRLIKSPTKLTDNSYESINLLPLNQGGFSLYARDATMDYGVYHQSGNPALELVEMSPNEVRLFNRTPETLELRLSVNQ